LLCSSAITIGTPSETHGEVRGFSFIYSGNFLVEAEMSENGRLRVNMGLHPMGLQWHLMPGAKIVLFSVEQRSILLSLIA